MRLIPAQSTREHAEHFTRLAQMASDDFFWHLFGARAQSVLRSMFMRRDNDNSYVCASFLLQSGEIAGMLHAFPAVEARSRADRSNWLYLRYAGWQIPRALWLGLRLRRVLAFLGSDLADGDFYIAMLAIYPRFRRRGYSQTLLKHAEELAANRECSHLALDVDASNQAALAAYRRAGFQQVAESPRVKLGAERLQLLRMVKPLAHQPACGSSEVKYSRTTSRKPSGT